MRVRYHRNKRVSKGATRRLEDTSNATGEERDAVQSTPADDDGAVPNPFLGSSDPDGLRRSGNSTPLRNDWKFGTWNVRSMSAGKQQIVEQEMKRNNIKVLGVA